MLNSLSEIPREYVRRSEEYARHINNDQPNPNWASKFLGYTFMHGANAIIEGSNYLFPSSHHESSRGQIGNPTTHREMWRGINVPSARIAGNGTQNQQIAAQNEMPKPRSRTRKRMPARGRGGGRPRGRGRARGRGRPFGGRGRGRNTRGPGTMRPYVRMVTGPRSRRPRTVITEGKTAPLRMDYVTETGTSIAQLPLVKSGKIVPNATKFPYRVWYDQVGLYYTDGEVGYPDGTPVVCIYDSVSGDLYHAIPFAPQWDYYQTEEMAALITGYQKYRFKSVAFEYVPSQGTTHDQRIFAFSVADIELLETTDIIPSTDIAVPTVSTMRKAKQMKGCVSHTTYHPYMYPCVVDPRWKPATTNWLKNHSLDFDDSGQVPAEMRAVVAGAFYLIGGGGEPDIDRKGELRIIGDLYMHFDLEVKGFGTANTKSTNTLLRREKMKMERIAYYLKHGELPPQKPPQAVKFKLFQGEKKKAAPRSASADSRQPRKSPSIPKQSLDDDFLVVAPKFDSTLGFPGEGPWTASREALHEWAAETATSNLSYHTVRTSQLSSLKKILNKGGDLKVPTETVSRLIQLLSIPPVRFGDNPHLALQTLVAELYDRTEEEERKGDQEAQPHGA